MFIDLQTKIISRETATGYPVMAYAVTDLQKECAEVTGLNTMEIAAGAGPTVLAQGSIAKGRFFFLNVVEDETNGREPLEIRINGDTNDAWEGTMFAYEADTTIGIVSIHITNTGSNSIKYNYLIGGDVV